MKASLLFKRTVRFITEMEYFKDPANDLKICGQGLRKFLGFASKPEVIRLTIEPDPDGGNIVLVKDEWDEFIVHAPLEPHDYLFLEATVDTWLKEQGFPPGRYRLTMSPETLPTLEEDRNA